MEPVNNLIAVPNCLHLGWERSPSFFCDASNMDRDGISSLLKEVNLQPHTSEYKILGPNNSSAYNSLTSSASFFNITKVFVYDFIAATNNINWAYITHFSFAVLHLMHSIFPSSEVSGHQGEDPISQKKLKQVEELWETTK